ncbi:MULTISPECIES: type II secretion system minor pseudopilin GspH [unclassified Hahella]|uniref:type II secretion system minor pseudopilin GspH n=1 Tax=unclassified Hahella TaxID=2624107 RepID=UPI001C1EA32D|nr:MULTISPECIES: type II secretion system minor pseudopilin GspH [unclassified Hahella]MBU6953209.1 type II secretion system minor pseudopilin GspH [Hahella sp. HN01]MDG9671017.1 type II secretion system minor pseudopilin GspH [Hahella sp. CR1]
MKRAHKGFTLIEILVVLVIISVMVGMVTLVVSGNRERRELENEARKLLAIMQMTSDEAIFQNVDIGLRLDDHGYAFMGFDDTALAWIELPQEFLKERELPEWVVLDFDKKNKEIELKNKDEGKKDKKDDKDKKFLPQILFLSSGENTPVNIELKLKSNEDIKFIIKSDGLNGFELKGLADDEDA